MTATNTEIVLYTAMAVKAVCCTAIFGFSVFNSKSTRFDPFALIALFCALTIVADLAQRTAPEASLPYSRLGCFTLNTLFITIACAAITKTSPSAFVFAWLMLVISGSLYTLGSFAFTEHQSFATGLFVIGGVLAVITAVSMLFSHFRSQLAAIFTYFVTLMYVLVALVFAVHGPFVTENMSLFAWTLGWVVADIAYVVLAALALLAYIPTASTKMDNPASTCPPSVLDWFEYVLITGKLGAQEDCVVVSEPK